MSTLKMKMVVGSISYADSLDNEPPMVHIEAYNGRNTLSLFLYQDDVRHIALGDIVDVTVGVDDEA